MSSDGGLGGLLGNLFGGKDGGGIGKVLQDLLGGGPMPDAPGASEKVNIPTPENSSGPIQAPGTRPGAPQAPQGHPGQPQAGQPQPGGPRPGAPQMGGQQQQMGGQPGQPGQSQPQYGGGQPQRPQSPQYGGQPQGSGGPQGAQEYGQPQTRPQAPQAPQAPRAPQPPQGGVAAGAAAGGAAAASGLDSLLERLRSAGLGDQVKSWLSDGPNKSIDPQQVTQAIGPQQMSELAKHAGVSPDEVSQGLAKALPAVVNEMTPHGQIPNASQVQNTISRLVGG